MILQPEKHHTVDLKNATLLEREKIRSFNSDARNPWFYSTMGGCHPRMVIIARNNYRVQYHGQVYDENLIVAGYYHMNTKTNVLGKYFNFINRVMVMNSSWYKKTMYVYQKKRQQSALSALSARAISFTIKAT